MNGEIIQGLSAVAGLIAGGVTEQLAISRATKQMEKLPAVPLWSGDIEYPDESKIETRKSIVTTKKLGKRVFSILGLSGALFFFSGSNAILEATSTPPKVIPQKVGLVLDRSASMVLTTNNRQLALTQENNLLSSVSNLTPNLNIETTSQDSAASQTFNSAVEVLPIGNANMDLAVNDLMSSSRNVYVVSNGNGFKSFNEVSKIERQAKSLHESINFYNLSSSSNSAANDMKLIAKSTGGKYYPNDYSFAAFSSDIKNKLNEYAITSKESSSNNFWDFLGVAAVSLAIGSLAYKSRSKFIIGSEED